MIGRIVALVVLVSSPAVFAAPPAVIDNFVRAHPDYRLLSLDDVRDVVEPVGADKFSAFVESDLRGDGKRDVAAVVVVSGSSPARYGLVAFHADAAGRVSNDAHWIVSPQTQRIVSIYVRERRRIEVAYCLECDSNPFVRWNGSEYEWYLFLPGDTANAYEELSEEEFDEDSPIALRSEPVMDSKTAAEVPLCAPVKIVKFLSGSTDGKRWYSVEAVVNGQKVSGFLPASALTVVSCKG